MKGISLLIYTLLFTFIFFIDQSAFMQIAGGLNGIPSQVDYLVTKLAKEVSYGQTVIIPQNSSVFISDCFFPNHDDLSKEGQDAAEEACYNSLGVVCVFFNYYKYIYISCQGILVKPIENIYLKAQRRPPIYTVERNMDTREFTLARQGPN